MHLFDLDRPLIQISLGEQRYAHFTTRHAVEGIQIFGGIGSGKTSGSGKMLAKKFLENGYGGLVLTAKQDEKDLWVKYCADAGASDDVLKELLALNGSSADARPKALIGVNGNRSRIVYGAKNLEQEFEPWLVKFSNSQDGQDAGAIEYVYALMAKDAGLAMPDVHLFSSQKGAGYFSVKRFDRDGSKRLHMHTAAGLLHSDFRTPALDYEDLLNLTGALTKDIREVEKMYRLAVFNVLAHNRDDHAKNFSFLMDETGAWKLAPAYDLTFSSGPNGEQSTMLMCEGKNPTIKQLVKLGREANLSKKLIDKILDQTKSALSCWLQLAQEYQVTGVNTETINQAINRK